MKLFYGGNMLSRWKNPFSSEHFSLSHDDPSVFVTSQWQRSNSPSLWYLAYRVFMALFFLSSMILSIVDARHLDKPYMYRVKWLIYLTNWGFTLCTVQAVLCLAMLLIKFRYAEKGRITTVKEHHSYLYQVYWVTHVIALDASFSITTLYWTVIYDAKTMELDYLNVLVHGANSIAMFLEHWMVSHPVRLGHSSYAFAFGAIYSTFSVVYHFAGGTNRDDGPNIYRVIDWTKPMPTMAICFGAMVFLVVIHTAMYGVHLVRIWLAQSLLNSDRGGGGDDKMQIPIGEVFTKGVVNEGAVP